MVLQSDLEELYKTVQRKKYTWYSIIRGIEKAVRKLETRAQTDNDRDLLCSIRSEIGKARVEHSQFSNKLKETRSRINQMNGSRARCNEINQSLDTLDCEAMLAIKQLREISKDILEITGTGEPSLPNVSSTTTRTLSTTTNPQSQPPSETYVSDRSGSIMKNTVDVFTADSFTRTSSADSADINQMIPPQKREISEIRNRIRKLRSVLPETESNDIDRYDSYFGASKQQNRSSGGDRKLPPGPPGPTQEIFEPKKGLSTGMGRVQLSTGATADHIRILHQMMDRNDVTMMMQDEYRNGMKAIKQSGGLVIPPRGDAVENAIKDLERVRTEHQKQKENRCGVDSKLKNENDSLRSKLCKMEGEFRAEIDALRHDLDNEDRQKREIDNANQDVKPMLELLAKQLMDEEKSMRKEIENVLVRHRNRTLDLIQAAQPK